MTSSQRNRVIVASLIGIGVVFLVILSVTGGSGSNDTKAAFCSDVRMAETAPYSTDMYLKMQQDFPYVQGDNGYTAANDAVNAYGPSSNRVTVDFLQKASVYLTGWC